MSWDINRVVIIGRLTKDVELKYTPGAPPLQSWALP